MSGLSENVACGIGRRPKITDGEARLETATNG